MREFLTPKEIYHKIVKKEIPKNGGVNILLSILNESEKTARVRAIEMLEKLLPNDPEIFCILENSLVSDKSELVRFAASKALLKIFPEQCDKPIKWAIKHEKSVFFF